MVRGGPFAEKTGETVSKKKAKKRIIRISFESEWIDGWDDKVFSTLAPANLKAGEKNFLPLSNFPKLLDLKTLKSRILLS